MVNNGIENTHQISMIKHSVGYILDMWTGIMIRKIINLGHITQEESVTGTNGRLNQMFNSLLKVIVNRHCSAKCPLKKYLKRGGKCYTKYSVQLVRILRKLPPNLTLKNIYSNNKTNVTD